MLCSDTSPWLQLQSVSKTVHVHGPNVFRVDSFTKIFKREVCIAMRNFGKMHLLIVT